MYFITPRYNSLWRNFDMIITLSTIFCHEETNPLQIAFRKLLTNLRNETPIVEDSNFSCQGQIPFFQRMGRMNLTMQFTYIQPT